MPIYSDRDIFNRIRRNVDVDVLAQLNSCSTQEIWQAYNRYKLEFEQQEAHYTRQLSIYNARRKENLNKIAESEGLTKTSDSTTKSKIRYKYSSYQEDMIKQGLQEGMKITELYEKVFRGIHNVRPSLKAFYNKCKKVQKS